jgi:hypothetical protein
LRPAAADVFGSFGYDGLGFVVIKRAFFGKGTLRIVASVLFVVNTGCAEKFSRFRSIQGDTRMTEGFERDSAVGAGNGSDLHRLVTARALRH